MINKVIVLKVMLYISVSSVMIMALSIPLYLNPLNKLNRLLDGGKSLDLDEIVFDMSSEFFSLLSLMFIFILYYHVSSGSMFPKSFSPEMHNAMNKFKSKFKNSRYRIITAIIILIFISVFIKQIVFFLCLSYILTLYLLWITLKDFKQFGNWINFIIFFSITFGTYLYLFLYTNTSILLIPIYHLIIFSLIKAVLFILKNFKYFFIAEYNAAKNEKQLVINTHILNKVLNDYKHMEKVIIKEQFTEHTLENVYKLQYTSEFEEFVKKLNLHNSTKEKIIKSYHQIIVNRIVVAKGIGETIISRNYTNLFIAISLAIIVFLLELVFVGLGVANEKFVSIMRMNIIILIVFRLVLRSVEIGIAFSQDIKSLDELKKSDISSKKRINLAINSLIEVILLSNIFYVLQTINDICCTSIPNLIIVFYDKLKYSIAVSLFNVSYPDKVLSFESVSFLYGLNQFVHLLQITLSVILISISITNYGSKSLKKSMYYILKSDERYVVKERMIIEGIEKIVISSDSLEGLKAAIDLKWEKSEIDSSKYEDINQLITTYLYERKN